MVPCDIFDVDFPIWCRTARARKIATYHEGRRFSYFQRVKSTSGSRQMINDLVRIFYLVGDIARVCRLFGESVASARRSVLILTSSTSHTFLPADASSRGGNVAVA